MSQKQKTSRVPRAKKTVPDAGKDADHSYTKTSKQPQKGKYKTNLSCDDDDDYSSDDSTSLLTTESTPCFGCKKTLSKSTSGVCCNFCEHWFCLNCSKLKRMVYQALKDSPESLMWFCTHCLTAFPGVKKMLLKVSALEDKFEKLETRVDKLEETPNATENIEHIVQEEVKEIRDIELRRLNLICFNIPESESESPEVRKTDDTNQVRSLLDVDMKMKDQALKFENPFRLGKRVYDADKVASRPRPLRITVNSFDDKRQILLANSVVKNPSEENKRKVFCTPDLTFKQREESAKLREELRYRRTILHEQNIKINKGRIVSINSRSQAMGPRFFPNRADRQGQSSERPFLGH